MLDIIRYRLHKYWIIYLHNIEHLFLMVIFIDILENVKVIWIYFMTILISLAQDSFQRNHEIILHNQLDCIYRFFINS